MNDHQPKESTGQPVPLSQSTSGICILCRSTDLSEVPGFSAYLDLPGHSDARIFRCNACSMMFLDPYPSPEELDKMYSEAYFVADDATKATESGSPLDYEGMAHGRMAKFHATVDLLKTFAPAPARLLDVGAATGEFLQVARDAGYDVAGIEISKFAASKAHELFGFDFFVGSLDAYQSDTLFDVIHLSHVFEHLVDVHASIQKMSSLLSPRGVIYIEVPFSWNWVERAHQRMGNNLSFSVWSVHHRSFFRPETLSAFFALHGFTCRHTTLTPPDRYPKSTLPERAKHAMWQGLSLFGQGLFIEAVFSRND